MHEGQIELSPATVADLVATQFPRWSGLPVSPVISHGTVNALFRLGNDLVLRFPLVPGSPADHRRRLEREQEHAVRIAAQVRLRVPEPVGLGAPGPGYPGPWSIYRWIPGETIAIDAGTGSGTGQPRPGHAQLDRQRLDRQHLDQLGLAADLAQFVQSVHALDPAGRSWDGRSRGGPLEVHDAQVRRAIDASRGLIDAAGLTRRWEHCLEATPDPSAEVVLHGDLMPGNLLIGNGRLAAVLDLGEGDVGDRAVDLMPAWNLLGPDARSHYRSELQVDDDCWERGRGWAIVQAIIALPYYIETNPVMAATARHTINALLAD